MDSGFVGVKCNGYRAAAKYSQSPEAELLEKS